MLLKAVLSLSEGIIQVDLTFEDLMIENSSFELKFLSHGVVPFGLGSA